MKIIISNFDDCFARLLENEGGYSNNQLDPGGETMYGVTLRVARAWGYLGPMKDLPLDTARKIAKANYWTPYRCDQLPPAIAFHVFDTVYHGGQAVHWLQETVGVSTDGVIGPKTAAAVRAAEPASVVMAFNRLRLKRLTVLTGWPEFGRGWTMRIIRNMEVF